MKSKIITDDNKIIFTDRINMFINEHIVKSIHYSCDNGNHNALIIYED